MDTVAGSCVWHLSIILSIVSLPGLSHIAVAAQFDPDSEKILIQPVFLSTENTMVGKVIE